MEGAKIRKNVKFQWILLAVSLGLLVYFCVSNNNLATLLGSLPGLNPLWLVCAAGCMALSWWADCLILRCLIGSAYETGYDTKSAFRITMVGQYFNSVTPYAVGGQPMQLLALTRQGISSGIAISALVRKYLVYQTTITLYSLAVIVAKYSFFRSKIQGFMALAIIGFAAQAAIVVLLLLFTRSPRFTTRLIHRAVWLLTRLHFMKRPEEISRKVKNQLEFYLQSNKAMQGNRRMREKVYACTFVQLTALFCVPFFIYKAFHNPGFPLLDMITAQSFVTMISSYTPLPGAAGAAEGSFLVLFRIFFREDVIRQAMLLWRLITYYSCIVFGAFFAGFVGKKEGPKLRYPGAKEGRKENEAAAPPPKNKGAYHE